MCDLSKLRELAQSSEKVEIDSKTLLELLDAAQAKADIITVEVVKKKRGPRNPRPSSPDDEKCARWLFKVLRVTAPNAREPNFDTWSNDVRLMCERDARTHKDICELFLWAHKDPFWCTNILSPKTLREQWDRLTLQRDRGPGARQSQQAGQKFNFTGADRSGDQSAQDEFMQRHAIEVPTEDIPL